MSETNVSAVAPVFVFFAASFQRLIVSSARLIGIAMNLNNLMPALINVATLTGNLHHEVEVGMKSGSAKHAKH